MDPVLAAAMIEAQQIVDVAFKTKKHEHFNFMYVPADQVAVVGREALNKVGCGLFPETEDFETITPIDDKCGGAVAVLRCKWKVIHKSGAEYKFSTDVPVVPERGRNSGWSRDAAKACFGSRTEALGYAYRDLLSIPREDAPDVSGSGGRGKPGPGTEQEQRQRQDAQQNPKKSIDQYLAELRSAEKFGAVIKIYQLAKRDVVTPSELASLDGLFAEKFVLKIQSCETIADVEKDAATAARLVPEGDCQKKVNAAIDLARVRIGVNTQ